MGPQSFPPLQGLRVLVAEDNVITLCVLQEILEGEGALVTGVGDGEQALFALTSDGDYQLVLTDLRMPVLDGLGLARCCRDRLPGIPVVGLTVARLPETCAQADEVGMVELLEKPPDIDALVAAVLRHARWPGADD
ncbi:response regulator [Marichromatium bheemlicum]|uniref:Response regulator n=1 Tax=Marichromatium bheemlicum TaxID=365339 RepID=A0ABX1I932_9GAMM|nr:response regulator [Marichromatium bheemlicum]NKN32700.1 response regulator [Marichromatium bheemlicum]